MKKSIILSLIAATFVAFTFTSCKDKEETQKITGLTIKPAELTLTPGETTRLAAMVTPEGAVANITWTSSNENIVTVSNNGAVTALELGSATITATSGEFSSKCEIQVKSVFETLNFTGAFLYNWDTTYSDKLDTFSDGSICKQALCYVEVYTEGFYLNESFELAGADRGAILTFEAPFYWAPDWLNKGEVGYYILGYWDINNEYADSALYQSGREASINQKDFAEAVHDFEVAYYIDRNQTRAMQALQLAAKQVSGATLTTYEYHTKEEGYNEDGYYGSQIPELYFGRGWFYADKNYTASGYMCSVEGYSLTADELLVDADTATYEFHDYGVHMKETESSIELLDTIVSFGQNYKYELALPTAKAPARKMIGKRQAVKMNMLTPEQKARHEAALHRTAAIKK